MNFIKKHTSLLVAILIGVLVFIGFLILKGVFFPDEAKAIYGDRLDGRSEVEITDDKKTEVKEKLSSFTSSVEVRIAGRIIYIDAKTDGNVNVDTAKNSSNAVLDVFSNKEKKYYDIQIIIENDTNTTQFPIIGYKHHTKNAFVWTKNR